MKTKLIALFAVPFLTSGLLRAEDKPAAPAAPEAPAKPGKDGKKGEPKVNPGEAFKKADANSDSSLPGRVQSAAPLQKGQQQG